LRYRIVIVTRDSARWIGIIAKAYGDLGLRPLYLVHDKTRDDTSSILERLGEDVAQISLPRDRGESSIAQLPHFVSEEWALRMDDDEFPSSRMIEFTKFALRKTRMQSIAYARREALREIEPLSYPTMERLFTAPHYPFHLDLQIRAFRPREIAPKDEVHSCGFIPTSVHVAPSDAYLVHFNTIVRPLSARLSKLARYEMESPGAGTLVSAGISVPELLNAARLRSKAFETREFDNLARSLAAIEHETTTDETNPEVESHIRSAFSQEAERSDDEAKLSELRDRIEALPKAFRTFLKLT